MSRRQVENGSVEDRETSKRERGRRFGFYSGAYVRGMAQGFDGGLHDTDISQHHLSHLIFVVDFILALTLKLFGLCSMVHVLDGS